jgi:hypothetical protein
MRYSGLGLRMVGALAAQALAGLFLYYRNPLTSTTKTNLQSPTKHGISPEVASPPHRPHGLLRLDYTNLELRSPLAKLWHRHQNECALPVADFKYRNRYGLGSDLHVWTQALCNAVQANVRIRTEDPWIYVDTDACSTTMSPTNSSATSAMGCYFPHAEPICPDDHKDGSAAGRPKLYTGNGMVSRGDCLHVLEENGNATFADVRSSGIEFLFSRLSSVVVREAERQLDALFGGPNSTSSAPDLLVTVHIRWGDKRREDRPRPVTEYVDAVHRLVAERRNDAAQGDPAVGIFLATEDPAAVEQFQQEAEKHGWLVFVDMYYQEFSNVRDASYNGNPRMAQNLQGRPGLVALASLLVAMQADDYVLTTSSNWSRLINELRKNVLNPRCHNCTRLVDLSPGEW